MRSSLSNLLKEEVPHVKQFVAFQRLSVVYDLQHGREGACSFPE